MVPENETAKKLEKFSAKKWVWVVTRIEEASNDEVPVAVFSHRSQAEDCAFKGPGDGAVYGFVLDGDL